VWPGVLPANEYSVFLYIGCFWKICNYLLDLFCRIDGIVAGIVAGIAAGIAGIVAGSVAGIVEIGRAHV